MRDTERASGKPTEAKDWAPGACAQPIREALHRDQFGLCAYCCQRIQAKGHSDEQPPNGNGGMRIEHFIAREAEPTRMYDWDNLLGSCGGRHRVLGQPAIQHCDRARGNKALKVDPTKGVPDPDVVFRYQRHASEDWLIVESDNPDAQKAIETLNLNAPHLAGGRRDAERGVATALRRCRTEQQRVQALRRRLQAATTPNGQGLLPPYAPVVVRYVRKRLRARGVTV